MKDRSRALRLAVLGAIISAAAPPALGAQSNPAFIVVALHVGEFIPTGSFENRGGVANLETAKYFGVELRHELIGDRVGLVLHGGITTTIRVRYTILTACTECRTDAPPVNAYQGALDLDLRTKAHDGFIAYLQAGPGVRRLVEFGGYAVPLQPDVSFAVIGMLHASAGIERLFDKQGLDLQLGAYSGRFNRSAVTDYVATMGFRF